MYSIFRKPIQLIFTLEYKDESIKLLNHLINEKCGDNINVKDAINDSHMTDKQEQAFAKSAVLAGLHACGNLSCSTLRLFVSNPDINGLSLVSCCYHKMTEFPMSKAFNERTFDSIDRGGTNNVNEKLYCLKSPHTLRLASQEPFSRYFLSHMISHSKRIFLPVCFYC